MKVSNYLVQKHAHFPPLCYYAPHSKALNFDTSVVISGPGQHSTKSCRDLTIVLILSHQWEGLRIRFCSNRHVLLSHVLLVLLAVDDSDFCIVVRAQLPNENKRKQTWVTSESHLTSDDETSSRLVEDEGLTITWWNLLSSFRHVSLILVHSPNDYYSFRNSVIKRSRKKSRK